VIGPGSAGAVGLLAIIVVGVPFLVGIFLGVRAVFRDLDNPPHSPSLWAAGTLAVGPVLFVGYLFVNAQLDKRDFVRDFNEIRAMSVLLQDSKQQIVVDDRHRCRGEFNAVLASGALASEKFDLVAQETAILEAAGWNVSRFLSGYEPIEFWFTATRNDQRIIYDHTGYRLGPEWCGSQFGYSSSSVATFPAPPNMLTSAELTSAAQQLVAYQSAARSALGMKSPLQPAEITIKRGLGTDRLCQVVKIREESSPDEADDQMLRVVSGVLEQEGWVSRRDSDRIIGEREGEFLTADFRPDVFQSVWYPSGCSVWPDVDNS